MNYLRSAIVLASVSIVALVAGCNDGSDVTTEDVTPTTAVREKGVDTQASGSTVCVQDIGGSDKDAAFLQVQASRVSKYLMGGNDPFDTSGAGYSPEYGAAGMKDPDMGNAKCVDAAKIIHQMHDKLYPPPTEKCDPKLMIRTKEGYVCPSPAPTSSVSSGPLGSACYLKADTFGFTVSPQDPDWPNLLDVALLLDGCWGEGLSGFFWVKEGIVWGAGNKDQKVNVFGTDPEPADLTDPLSGSTGATAGAVFTNTGVPTKVVLWPGWFTGGGGWPAGTPCSTYGLAPGATTSKQIVLNSTGTQRKCI